MPQSARRSKTDWSSCKETQPLQLWVQDSKCSLLPDQLMLCRPFITIICLEILVSQFYCAEWKSSSAAVLNLSPNKYFSFHSPYREPSTATLLNWVPTGNVTALCSAQHTLPSTAKAAFCHFKQTQSTLSQQASLMHWQRLIQQKPVCTTCICQKVLYGFCPTWPAGSPGKLHLSG